MHPSEWRVDSIELLDWIANDWEVRHQGHETHVLKLLSTQIALKNAKSCLLYLVLVLVFDQFVNVTQRCWKLVEAKLYGNVPVGHLNL